MRDAWERRQDFVNALAALPFDRDDDASYKEVLAEVHDHGITRPDFCRLDEKPHEWVSDTGAEWHYKLRSVRNHQVWGHKLFEELA
jgi:hypothetical protein